LKLERLTGRIGAVVHGVRLSGDLDVRTVASLREALLRHKVLFFRRQTHLDDTMQEDFASLLGVPERHPTAPVKDGTRVTWSLDSEDGVRANSWHTDITFLPAAPAASILRAVILPSVGGDTLWANTCTGYEQLPEPLKNFAHGLRALHSNNFDYAPTRADIEVKGDHGFQRVTIEAEHPVVHVHPETGEHGLLLGHFFRTIVGMSHAESLQFYTILQSHVTRPENVVRWRWSPGDVAIWDNRATQHYGVNDYTEQRVMNRVSLRGEVMVGVDGRPSIQKQPAA
jgi:taurine dioxygenase